MQFATWTRLLIREGFKVNKNAKVFSNHFKLGRLVDSHPHPTLFLKGYDREGVTCKRKAPTERLPVEPKGKKRKSVNDDNGIIHDNDIIHVFDTPE